MTSTQTKPKPLLVLYAVSGDQPPDARRWQLYLWAEGGRHVGDVQTHFTGTYAYASRQARQYAHDHGCYVYGVQAGPPFMIGS